MEEAGRAFEEAEALFGEEAFNERIGWKKDENNDQGDVVWAKKTPRGKMVTISVSIHLFFQLSGDQTPYHTFISSNHVIVYGFSGQLYSFNLKTSGKTCFEEYRNAKVRV